MKFFDNVENTVKNDLQQTLKQDSKLSIAASCFSIYAFEVLKNELEKVSELRFIFTSPTFTAEKTQKDKREFYIPRLGRERNLYGSEFELKLRNELSQKAIAKECADWIRRKVSFKSNITQNSIAQIGNIEVETGKTLDEQIRLNEEREKRQQRIDSLERLARAEKQPKKKFELVQKIKQLEIEKHGKQN